MSQKLEAGDVVMMLNFDILNNRFMLYRYVLIMVTLTLTGASCDSMDNKLLIVNKSQKAFYCRAILDSVEGVKSFDYLSIDNRLPTNPNDSLWASFTFKNEDWAYKINSFGVDSGFIREISNAGISTILAWNL